MRIAYNMWYDVVIIFLVPESILPVMQHTFSFKDRHGSVSLWLDGRILISEFTGPCSGTLAKRYQQAVAGSIEHMGGEPWGYVSCSIDFEAATEGALEILSQTYQLCITHRCVADAYVLGSPVGRAQIVKMRDAFVGVRDTEAVMFDNLDAALEDVKQRLTQQSDALSS